MPHATRRKASRNSRHDNDDDEDDDDDDYGGYQKSSSSRHSMNASPSSLPDNYHNDAAYESDGGWSDDSGKDSDAYVESHRGRQSMKSSPAEADADASAVFDATRQRRTNKKVSSSSSPKKLASRKIASFFTASKPADDDVGNRELPDNSQQHLQSNYYHNNYYHDPPPPLSRSSSSSSALHQQQHHPVVDQAVRAPDPVSRAALVAGYEAAEYDNDHTVTNEQIELEAAAAHHYDHAAASKDHSEAPDGKTFRSTALTEAEQKLRYTIACLILGLVVAVVIVAGLVGGILGSIVFAKNKDASAAQATTTASLSPTIIVTSAPSLRPVLTLPPTVSPTPFRLVTNQKLYDSIVAASPNAEKFISDDGSPQNLAFVSIQAEDASLETQRLLQRYAMRVFYYSTSGPTTWITKDGWESADNECSWFTTADDPTTVCDSDNMLVTLELEANGVTGSLPDELSMLTSLTRLYIKGVAGSAGLVGSIPETLDQLTSMSVVVLNDHQFASPLRANVLSAWSQLTVINIIGSRLTGIIPSSVSSLTLCSNFLLDSNELTGTIPSDIASMTSLAAFGVSGNLLTGTIPALSIPSMKSFSVSSNLLTGELPSFAGMPSLVKLSLDGNVFAGSLDFCGSSSTVVDCFVNCTCGCTCV